MTPRNATNWIGSSCRFSKSEAKPPGQPSPWEVSYSPSNPDGSRKKCENCFLWSRDERCALLSPETHVGKTYICSYHCHGQPSDERRDLGATALTPEVVGLFETKGGTSCDTCRFYSDGECLAVNGDDGEPARVAAKGCCARWDGKGDDEAEREF